jgi:predicted ATPase
MVACECTRIHHRRRVVLTGGPGAGKTALLELIRQSFCRHVRVLPEAAGVVFGGGFPREDDLVCRQAAQRAMFYVQRELEITGDAHDAAVVLCDRGTIDGVAYWPGSGNEYWASLGTTLEQQVGRYDAVIHLRTPPSEQGYNLQNPLRTESAAEAAEIDTHIAEAWAPHPRRFLVDASASFLDKATRALAILSAEIPSCCREHVIPALKTHQAATGGAATLGGALEANQ